MLKPAIQSKNILQSFPHGSNKTPLICLGATKVIKVKKKKLQGGRGFFYFFLAKEIYFYAAKCPSAPSIVVSFCVHGLENMCRCVFTPSADAGVYTDYCSGPTVGPKDPGTCKRLDEVSNGYQSGKVACGSLTAGRA